MSDLPQSVDEGIERLKIDLGEEELEKLRQLKRSDLWGLHLGLGMYIRNSYGLWGGNSVLRNDLAKNKGGMMHVDSMSTYLIELLWEQLQEQGDDSELD